MIVPVIKLKLIYIYSFRVQYRIFFEIAISFLVLCLRVFVEILR